MGRARRCGCPGKRASSDQAWAEWGRGYINASSTRECGFRAGFAAECRRMRGHSFRVIKGLSAKWLYSISYWNRLFIGAQPKGRRFKSYSRNQITTINQILKCRLPGRRLRLQNPWKHCGSKRVRKSENRPQVISVERDSGQQVTLRTGR
jgi:hypothetical protein